MFYKVNFFLGHYNEYTAYFYRVVYKTIIMILKWTT